MSQPDSLAQGQLTVPGDVNNCPGLAVHPFLHVFLTHKWPISAEQCCPPPVSGIWSLVPGRGQDLLTFLMASKVWALDSCVGAGVVQGSSGGGGAVPFTNTLSVARGALLCSPVSAGDPQRN